MPNDRQKLALMPSEYYKRQFFSCFWFERSGLRTAIEVLGPETVLFETDFPHPTCLYPGGPDGVPTPGRWPNWTTTRVGWCCRTTPPACTAYPSDAARAGRRDKPRGFWAWIVRKNLDDPRQRKPGGRRLSGWSAPGSSTPSAAGGR